MPLRWGCKREQEQTASRNKPRVFGNFGPDFRLEWREVDPEQQPDAEKSQAQPAEDGLERNPEVEEFFQRLMEKQGLHRPKPDAEAIAKALQAIQTLAVRSEEEESKTGVDPAGEGSGEETTSGCPHCGYQNLNGNQFCGICGGPLGQLGSGTGPKPSGVRGEAQHHYHHHYHHFLAGQDADTLATLGQRSSATGSGVSGAAKDLKFRAAPAGPGTSRAEATIRQLAQDWAQACNNKQIDDLLEFYAPDAMVMRPNVPPVRGMAAIREFFVAALQAGLGDVEMELLRAEVLGDVAYQAGRCKMLVPVAMGKRREERGKYVIIFAKQKGGEWKAVVDSWSSDLGLNVAAESLTSHAPATTPPKPRRI
jgi:uncharacterized protein (TIGR02246 family)